MGIWNTPSLYFILFFSQMSQALHVTRERPEMGIHVLRAPKEMSLCVSSVLLEHAVCCSWLCWQMRPLWAPAAARHAQFLSGLQKTGPFPPAEWGLVSLSTVSGRKKKPCCEGGQTQVPGKVADAPACQCSRSFRMMPSIMCLIFWLAPECSGTWTQWTLCWTSSWPFQLNYSVLLCSVLFYSIQWGQYSTGSIAQVVWDVQTARELLFLGFTSVFFFFFSY